MTASIGILLIEKDKSIRNIVKKFLEKKEYQIAVADSFNDTIEAITTNKFKIILISDSLDDIEFETIINQIKVKYSNLVIILLLKEVNLNFFKNYTYFIKPVNLIKLEELIREKVKSFSLNFKNQELLNFINQNAKVNQNMLISILDPTSRKLGLIYLSGLNFVHSEYDELIGEEAFYSILKLDQGLVSYFDGVEPPIITMNFTIDNNNYSIIENDNLLIPQDLIPITTYDMNIPINNNDFLKIDTNDDFLNNAINKFEYNNDFYEKNISESNYSSLDNIVDKLNEEKEKISIEPPKIDKRVLIIDDDITSRKINSEVFKSKGFDVLVLESALKAKDVIEQGEKFDFIITDLNMPNLTGIEFLVWMKSKNPNSKIIVISGFFSEKIEDFMQKNGVIKYFKKPIKVKDLNDFIDNSILSKKPTLSIKEENLDILEYIKLSTLSNQKNLIEIMDTNTNKIGYIYIDSAKILHAKYDNIFGPDAFYQILEIQNPKFEKMPWISPKENSINATIDILIKAKELLKKDEIIKFMETKIEDDKDVIGKDEKQKILIVDDDITSIKILNSYLQKKGYKTQVTDSPIEAMELIKKESFNIVITDVNMPEMNGFELLLWIKQYFHKIKVIMVTAFGSETVKSLSSQKGAFYFFDKPINFKEMDYLLDTIYSSEDFSEDINLIDFIKLSAVSKANKLILITSLLSNTNGYIYLSNGKFLHVEFSNLKGQQALEKILTTNNLIFSETTWVMPSEKTIDMDAIRVLEYFSNKLQKSELIYNSEKEVSNKDSIQTNSENKSLEVFVKQKEIISYIEKEKDPIKKMTIYENGVCMGIIIGLTNKEDVLNIMSNFSKEEVLKQKDNKMLIYDDISVTILFDDNNIVQEINFGKFFKGKTSRGLAIDDFMKKGFELYGKPDACTLKGAVWRNLSLFSFDGKFVTSIRLRAVNS